jgi:hypothetical protein
MLFAAFYASFAAAQGRYAPSEFGKTQAPTTGAGAPDVKPLLGDSVTPRPPGTNSSTAPPVTSESSNPYRNSSPSTNNSPKILPLDNGDTQPIRGTSSAQTAAAYDYSSPANPNTPAQGGVGLKPSAMMRVMVLNPPQGSLLRGQPVTLMEAIGGARNRAEQTERVSAYWDLCSAVADYYLGLREQEELRKLRSFAQQVGPAWSQAEAELGTRVGTSQRAALASQLRVASLMGRGLTNLPLPADTPHCASYITHYEQIFQGGGPAEAHELADLLPLRYAELQDAATSVTRSEQYLDSVASRGGDGTDSLSALRLLALQRRAFVQIARDYNERIARYSELASPGQLSAGRLTGMLINTGTATATKAASPAPPPHRQSRNATSPPPPTFAAGSPPPAIPNAASATHDEAVKQASAVESTAAQSPPRQERSLLVPTSRSTAGYP